MGEGGHLRQGLLDQLEAVLHGGRPSPAPVRPQRVRKREVDVRRDELPIKVHHPQEGLQLLLVLRGWEVLYRLHMPQDRRRPIGGDVVAQEINLLAGQLTLLHVEEQAILLKSLKNQVEMMQVLLCAGAADENIVQVQKVKSSPDSTSSRKHWKDWPVLRSPNGILRNSHSPNVVITAVL